jgi:hypothetical protein
MSTSDILLSFFGLKQNTVLLVNLDQNIGLEKKSNYRRYRLFYSANIGGFKENFRRFIRFEGKL